MSLQFDVIVGNPPYQNSSDSKQKGMRGSLKNYYSLFIEKSIDLLKDGGYLAYITPPGYLKTTNVEKRSNLLKLIQKYNLLYVDLDVAKYFPSVSLPIISWFLLKKDNEYVGTKFNDDRTIDISDRSVIPIDNTDRVDDLLGKTKNFSFVRDDHNKIVDRCITNKQNFVILSQVSPKQLEVSINDYLYNKKGKKKPVHIMICDDLNHANRVSDIMKSDDATFINSTVRYGDANVYPGIINYINISHAI